MHSLRFNQLALDNSNGRNGIVSGRPGDNGIPLSDP
jgi:hypothetical protein